MATPPDTTNYGQGFQTPGLGSAGAYQVSGYPYVTGSGNYPLAAGTQQEIIFPAVTKSITLMPYSSLGFSGNSCQLVLAFADPANPRVESVGHYAHFPVYDVLAGETWKNPITIDVKCSRVWIKEVGTPGDGVFWTLYASLTSINPAPIYNLTGSGINV